MLEIVLRYFYFIVSFMLLFTVPVQAYIDPSVMTYAIQALAGIAIALGTFFGLYWRKIRKPVLRFFNLDETVGREEESDELVFFDPSLMEEEKRIVLPKLKDGTDSEGRKKGKLREIAEDMIPALFITLSGCFMLCIYAPLDLYFNNKNEFWFSERILISEQMITFLITILIIILFYYLCRLVGKGFYSFVLFLTTDIFICSYIQGNFRIANLPPMDGSAVDWSIYNNENTITLIIWIVITLILLFVYKYVRAKGFRSVAIVVSVFLTMVLTVSLISSYIGSRSIVGNTEFECSKDHEFDVSDVENFYILILDAVDAHTYQEVAEAHPEYKEWFNDFTFFPNTTCVYPFTSRAIPHILSGFIFENERDFTEFSTDAIDNSPFLKALEENGYQMSIYEPELTYSGYQLDRFANIRTDNFQLNPEYELVFIKKQIKLALFKYFPYFLKKYVLVDTNIFSLMKGSNPFTTYNDEFLQDIMDEENVTHTRKKIFAFYHVQGAHLPFIYDKNVNTIPEEQGSYYQNIEASMTIAGAFLNKLKEAGVYDNSTIIIMADHGYQARNGGIMERFNPLFMIKGFQEKHAYNASEAPLSYFDLPEAYNRLLAHQPAVNCFDAKEGDQRERRLLYLKWLEEDLIKECIQDGYAADYENIKLTGNEYYR